jgi:hypothetical protein
MTFTDIGCETIGGYNPIRCSHDIHDKWLHVPVIRKTNDSLTCAIDFPRLPSTKHSNEVMLLIN